jgi:hypothetical protein
MGELTERGKIVAAGGAQLAAPNGDDTLSPLQDQDSGSAATDSAAEPEKGQAPDDTASAEPGPASTEQDVNVLPVVEQADDTSAADRETRS